jgi:hypothetical protein
VVGGSRDDPRLDYAGFTDVEVPDVIPDEVDFRTRYAQVNILILCMVVIDGTDNMSLGRRQTNSRSRSSVDGKTPLDSVCREKSNTFSNTSARSSIFQLWQVLDPTDRCRTVRSDGFLLLQRRF